VAASRSQARLAFECGFKLLNTLYFRPQTKEELFNLCHASACNVVECAIGVLKHPFHILQEASRYNMDMQILILVALCALHNFIRRYDPEEVIDLDDTNDLQFGDRDEGYLASGLPNQHVQKQANARRDQIAQQMWDDYTSVLAARDP